MNLSTHTFRLKCPLNSNSIKSAFTTYACINHRWEGKKWEEEKNAHRRKSNQPHGRPTRGTEKKKQRHTHDKKPKKMRTCCIPVDAVASFWCSKAEVMFRENVKIVPSNRLISFSFFRLFWWQICFCFEIFPLVWNGPCDEEQLPTLEKSLALTFSEMSFKPEMRKNYHKIIA